MLHGALVGAVTGLIASAVIQTIIALATLPPERPQADHTGLLELLMGIAVGTVNAATDSRLLRHLRSVWVRFATRSSFGRWTLRFWRHVVQFVSPEFVFYSPLSVNDCIQNLQDAMDKEGRLPSPLLDRKTKPIVGKIRGHRLTLRARRTLAYRNSFAPIFRGNLVAYRLGTTVWGRCSMHPAVLVFMAFWLLGVVRIWVGVVIPSIIDLTLGRTLLTGEFGYDYGSILFAPLFPLVGISIPLLGIILGKGEEEAIVQFLERTLDVRKTRCLA